jgi:hypothetical protein
MHPMHAYYRYTTSRQEISPLCMRTAGILQPAKNTLTRAGKCFLVGLLRIESSLHNRMAISAAVPRTAGRILCRGAENRTRSTRTRSVRTTGILHPDKESDPARAAQQSYDTPDKMQLPKAYRTAGIRQPEARNSMDASIHVFRTPGMKAICLQPVAPHLSTNLPLCTHHIKLRTA